MNIKKKLVLSVLILVFIQFSFGFNLHNTQICVISFCFGYYLGKRRPPQVYVEIIDCIFSFKKWTQ